MAHSVAPIARHRSRPDARPPAVSCCRWSPSGCCRSRRKQPRRPRAASSTVDPRRACRKRRLRFPSSASSTSRWGRPFRRRRRRCRSCIADPGDRRRRIKPGIAYSFRRCGFTHGRRGIGEHTNRHRRRRSHRHGRRDNRRRRRWWFRPGGSGFGSRQRFGRAAPALRASPRQSSARRSGVATFGRPKRQAASASASGARGTVITNVSGRRSG